ncbi:DUF3052 family protein [Flagellimonas nanhaiensis]|uniref:DUF3052 family protein n=1 Tax=Flagellimonas nanhaiensis TaxID=2292706 RepID=A0A371JUX9_9FLAO|nr:DUF3052 family protein [Allomuricauda nanhaiensis]RDY61580.1 DUF3052 family protein [Allomuricauda nanhaiensis]
MELKATVILTESAGYSKTPLAKKLGIKENFKIVLYNSPSHYWDLFSDLPENIQIIKKPKEQTIDFVHLFCTSHKELIKTVSKYHVSIKKTGMLWVSWPKGTSKIKTDLKRDMIREHLLSVGLVDIKVAAVDEDWSGLKFVYRLKDRN